MQYGQYGPEWTSSASMWPLLLLLIYPVVDHDADHRVWLERFMGNNKEFAPVDIVFYVLHLYYYVLIKDFWSEQRNMLLQERKIRPTIKKLKGG